MKMEHPKYREKVLIGLENAPPSFNVRGKVMGPGGANLQYITHETGAIVTIRGRGSGYIEPSTGQESIEPLHICIEHSKYEVLQAGRQLAFNLIDTVQQEWASVQHQIEHQPQQQHQPQHQQQVQAQQAQLPMTVQIHPSQVSSTSSPVTGGNEIVNNANLVSTTVTVPAFAQQTISQMVSLPPPSVAMPPPSLHMPPQVSVAGTNGSATAQGDGSLQSLSALVHAPPPSMTGVQEVPTSQASNPPAQQQTLSIQSQPQQLFVSGQNTLIQPQTLIPQQQQVLTQGQVITQQPQIIQSYPLQYMQASNGQMVLAYPNIVRPGSGGADGGAGGQTQQVMFLQYGQTANVRPAGLRAQPPPQQTATIPQIVQIVNPQTGQIQHVLQHIQPQIQMQQLQLQHQVVGGGGSILGQQVLMPIQAPLQFTTQSQQMIIAQPPPQLQQQMVPVSQGLQMTSQGQLIAPTQVVASTGSCQSQHIATTVAIARHPQGQKRRFEGEPNAYVQPPISLSVPPPSQGNQQQMNKKGMGNDGSQSRVQQSSQVQLQDGQLSAEKGQYGSDEWRGSPTPSSVSQNSRGDTIKPEQPKRGRPAQVDVNSDQHSKSSHVKYANFKSAQPGQVHQIQPSPSQQATTQALYKNQVAVQPQPTVPQQAVITAQQLYGIDLAGTTAQAATVQQQASGAAAAAAQQQGLYQQQVYPTHNQQAIQSAQYGTMYQQPPQYAPYNPWILPS